MNGDAADADLIRRIGDKDRLALRTLFARYHLRLYRFLTRLTKNEAMAEELVNEVFLKVWRSAGSFKGNSAASSWIFAIAHNAAISQLRKRREDPLSEESAASLADESDTPEETAMKVSKADAIRACMDRLSTDHREVIDLVYYQERSVREVAQIVGIPENTVKTRMFHARQKLGVLLSEAGVDRGWP